MTDAKKVNIFGDIQVHLNNTCDMNCPHCYVESDINKRNWLDIELLKTILDFFKDKSVENMRILGGEVFEPNKKLLPYLILFYKYNYNLVLVSNGYHLYDFIDEIVFSRINELIFSVYGFARSHNTFVGKNESFERIVSCIRRIKEINSNIKISINTLLTKHNVDDFLDFLTYFDSLGVDEVKILSLSNIGRMRKNRVELLKVNQSCRCEIIKQVHFNKYSNISIVYEVETDESKRICKINEKSMLCFDHQGACYPCHLLIGNKRYSIGNIRESNLSFITSSQNYESILNLIDNNRCLALSIEKPSPEWSCPLYFSRIR